MIQTLSKPALSAIFAASLGIMGYFGNFTGVDKTTLESEYIKKGEATFDDLRLSIKKRYYDERKKWQQNRNTEPKQEKKLALKEIEEIETNEVSVPESIKEAVQIKEEIITQTTKTSSKQASFTSQISCANMGVNEYKISKKCRMKLYDFFKTINKDEYQFEIIPLVDNHDFKILKQLKKNPELCQNIDPRISDIQMQRLFSLANAGLGVYRIKEARWLLRQRFGKDVNVKFTPYTINTKFDRGFIIRLYK